jgi:DNA repair exonuclease SbcCD ATPase subunit
MSTEPQTQPPTDEDKRLEEIMNRCHQDTVPGIWAKHGKENIMKYLLQATQPWREKCEAMIRQKKNLELEFKSIKEARDSYAEAFTTQTGLHSKHAQLADKYLNELVNLREQLERATKAYSDVQEENRKFEEIIRQQREVLTYYADEATYVQGEYGYQMISPVECDNGTKARKALSLTQSPEKKG